MNYFLLFFAFSIDICQNLVFYYLPIASARETDISSAPIKIGPATLRLSLCPNYYDNLGEM
jgi:hypothetical protein